MLTDHFIAFALNYFLSSKRIEDLRGWLIARPLIKRLAQFQSLIIQTHRRMIQKIPSGYMREMVKASWLLEEGGVCIAPLKVKRIKSAPP
jgi:hypothetical protein